MDAVHGLLEIVHLKVYADPATPVKVEVGLAALLNDVPVTLPITMLHAPVPIVAVFAASVTVVNPHVAEPV